MIGKYSIIETNKKNLGDKLTIGNFVTIGWDTIIGNGCLIGNYCEISDCVIIGQNTVLQGRTRIGHACKIGSCVQIRYGTILTPFTVLNYGVFLGANVIALGPSSPDIRTKIGGNSFIGAGSQIMPNIHICAGVIIGAMSFVNKDITEPGTYVGIPVKRIK